MKCNWLNCEAEGTKPQLDRNGHQWSCLCVEHDAKLTKYCNFNDPGWSPQRMMAAWINAQGGPAAAAKRMTGRQ
jgi:hypothetical protein